MGTPPETAQEQSRCMGATRGCWRLDPHRAATSESDTPDDSTQRRPSGKRKYASSVS
jgi:hypothetical protein